jgi:hypothetical protein
MTTAPCGSRPARSRGAEGGGNVLGELRAGGGVNGVGVREAFEIPELSECADNVLGVSEDGDGIWLETGTGSLAGFELAVEEDGWIGEFFPGEAEGGAKEDLGRPLARSGP